jgi:hypothetical protein
VSISIWIRLLQHPSYSTTLLKCLPLIVKKEGACRRRPFYVASGFKREKLSSRTKTFSRPSEILVAYDCNLNATCRALAISYSIPTGRIWPGDRATLGKSGAHGDRCRKFGFRITKLTRQRGRGIATTEAPEEIMAATPNKSTDRGSESYRKVIYPVSIILPSW